MLDVEEIDAREDEHSHAIIDEYHKSSE